LYKSLSAEKRQKRKKHSNTSIKGKGSPYSIAERRVPELIPVLGSQPAGDVSHKPGSRLPLLSARPAVTLATLKKAATKHKYKQTERNDQVYHKYMTLYTEVGAYA